MQRRKSPLQGLLSQLVVLAMLVSIGFASTQASAADAKRIDLNRASAEQLESLPGVGEVRAEAIVAERKRRGGFKNVDELLEVRGIGEKAIEKLRPLVKVSSGNTKP